MSVVHSVCCVLRLMRRRRLSMLMSGDLKSSRCAMCSNREESKVLMRVCISVCSSLV